MLTRRSGKAQKMAAEVFKKESSTRASAKVELSGFHWHHPAIEACVKGEADGILLPIYPDEKPMGGLARVVDLRFFGAISRFRGQQISGTEGECVWIPLALKGASTLPQSLSAALFIFGGGLAADSSVKTKRPTPTTASMKLLTKNLKTAGDKTWAVSRQDFGDVPESFFHQHFPKVQFKIFP